MQHRASQDCLLFSIAHRIATAKHDKRVGTYSHDRNQFLEAFKAEGAEATQVSGELACFSEQGIRGQALKSYRPASTKPALVLECMAKQSELAKRKNAILMNHNFSILSSSRKKVLNQMGAKRYPDGVLGLSPSE